MAGYVTFTQELFHKNDMPNALPLCVPVTKDKVHIVDTTMFFAKESGGVKRYLLAKHAWMTHTNAARHTLLVPHARDRREGDILSLASPPLPFSNGYRLPLNMPRWRNYLRTLEPDLIEVGDPYQLAWAALSAGSACNVPVVGFYHSDLPRMIGARLGDWSIPLVNRYVAKLYRRFDLVLAPSQTMVENLRIVGVDRVELQPLGVDTQLFHPRQRDPDLRKKLGLSDETRLLIFAGRFAREKNVPVLLDALRRLGPHYHLLLVGSGNGRLELPPNVTHHPFVGSEAALARLMASCEAFVHAGDQETFGLVILEAMACGVPVVGIASGGIGELIDEAVGVLAARSEPKLFAHAIAALFERDLKVLGQRCRQRVEASYSWDQVLRSLMGNYARVTGNTFPYTSTPLRAAG